MAPWTRKDLLLEETKSTPVHISTIKRAFDFEIKARQSPCQVVKECARENQGGNSNHYAASRIACLNQAGYSKEWYEEQLREGGQPNLQVKNRHLEQFQQRQELSLRQNGRRVSPGLARYLRVGREVRLIARFRLENEERGRQGWRTDDRCRGCRREKETLDHILVCGDFKITREELLDDDGKGANIMKEILNWRELTNE